MDLIECDIKHGLSIKPPWEPFDQMATQNQNLAISRLNNVHSRLAQCSMFNA